MRNLKIFESPRRARKKLAAMAVLGLAAAGIGAAVLGSASAATTWTVNDDLTGPGTCTAPDFSTIQAAINDPGVTGGDTIQVCAGSYNETVNVTKSVTLNGAQAGVDARSGRGLVSDESVIADTCGPVRILADKVTIDGFTIQGSTQSDPCFIAGIWTNPGFSATQGGHKIYNNIVQDNINGLELDNTGAFPTEVKQNLFRNNNNPGPASGNAIVVSFGLNDAVIDSNKFEGHDSGSFSVQTTGNGDIAFSNNELAAGANENVAWIGVTDGSITDNTSSGSGASATVNLFGGDSGITVARNDLANGDRGVALSDPYSVGPNSDIVVSDDNNITGNATAGLEVESGSYSDPTLDATCNWWDSASGPTHAGNPGGTGDAVVDPDGVVDYTPWLTAPAPAGACNGPLSTQQQKQAIRDSLVAKQTGASKHDAHEIGEAIKHIDKSLAPENWVDGEHLNAKKGHKVFDEEKEAVGHLEHVDNVDVTSEMDGLVAIDRKLAQTAINDIDPATNPKRQKKVDEEKAKANQDLAKGDSETKRKEKIEHYKHAWEHAQKAIEEGNKTN